MIPWSDQAHLELAGIYLRDHHLDEAEREYIALLEIKPGSSSACHGLGVIAIECGDEDAAVRNLDRAIELDPHDARPLIDRAKLELSRGRPESGLHFLDQAGSIDAGEPEVHYQRSLALTRLGRSALARTEMETSTRLREERKHIQQLLDEMLASPGDLDHQYDAAAGSSSTAIPRKASLDREDPP